MNKLLCLLRQWWKSHLVSFDDWFTFMSGDDQQFKRIVPSAVSMWSWLSRSYRQSATVDWVLRLFVKREVKLQDLLLNHIQSLYGSSKSRTCRHLRWSRWKNEQWSVTHKPIWITTANFTYRYKKYQYWKHHWNRLSQRQFIILFSMQFLNCNSLIWHHLLVLINLLLFGWRNITSCTLIMVEKLSY